MPMNINEPTEHPVLEAIKISYLHIALYILATVIFALYPWLMEWIFSNHEDKVPRIMGPEMAVLLALTFGVVEILLIKLGHYEVVKCWKLGIDKAI